MEEEPERHNKAVLRTLEEGDLVTFDRVVFLHWGVYIGMYQLFTNVLCPVVEYLYFGISFHILTFEYSF